MLRRRYREQIDKEKDELVHRLGYIENAEMHLDTFDYLKRRGSMREVALGQTKGEEWRKEYEAEMKRLADKKKEIEDKKREKEEEAVKLRESVREAERSKRKAEIEESIRRLKENTDKRQEL